MNTARTAVLVLATVSTGLTAGVFTLYSNALMPGLRATDDRTFVAAFQSIDRAIINPWWLGGGFFGVLLLTMLASILHVGAAWRSVLPWTLVALVLHIVVVAITLTVNVPLNDAIKAAGDPDQLDVAAVRAAFSESRWVAWNAVRVALDVGAVVALCIGLVVHGRADAADATAGWQRPGPVHQVEGEVLPVAAGPGEPHETLEHAGAVGRG